MPTLRRRLLFRLVTNQGLERQVRRVPALQRRAYRAARRYVAGETRDQALEAVRQLRRGLPVCCYVPYGRDWFRYWMRRLAEAQGTG